MKGPWTKEEDEIVLKLVEKFGPKNWSKVANNLPGRIGKQCRERYYKINSDIKKINKNNNSRWHNHLNPKIRKERWTEEEDSAIMEAHKLY